MLQYYCDSKNSDFILIWLSQFDESAAFTSQSFYLQLNGGGADEVQRFTVPDVDVHGVEGQIPKEPALLSGLQETVVYSELDLQTRRTLTKREETSDIHDVKLKQHINAF